ncbi:MAG TPA: hypothetical protein VKX49_04515 [Bryobacteraceae bacterium]|nr:hypothetical protein [Bryobacteraceae bacterium]
MFQGLAFVLLSLPLAAQVNVLTYQYENTRAGQNLNELLLTKSNVNANQFGKLFSYPVDGQIYGQPLYLAGVNVQGKGFHNVVFVATEHDSVYAFDADSNAGANATPLWAVHFTNGTTITTVPATDVNCGQIDPEIGITSTPVIDQNSGTIYVVAMRKLIGATASYEHQLHALDLTSGAERPGSPVTIQASYPGTGEGGNTLTFQPKNYKQRPGLLLLNGVVYTAWSSHCDIGLYHGWLIGYDAKTLQQVLVYNNTPNGNEGSFWAGGAAPAADSNGNIFLVAGNGSFDANRGGIDLGESFIKLSTSNGLRALDYFTPFNFNELNNGDADVGSAGVAFVGDEAGNASHPHLMAGSGKEGRIYLIDRDNLGHWQAVSDSQIPGSVAGAIGGLFGNPAYFNQAVYFCGAGDSLKAFPVSNAQLAAAPSSKSSATFGYPGCVPTISASGNSNGIVWVLESSATLHAYDASNLAHELYNSNQNNMRDALGSYVKFTVPMLANGKVYAGTANALVVYGLLGSLNITNAASGQQNFIAPGSLVAVYGTGNIGIPPARFPIPTTVNGVTMTINNMPAPLLFGSNGQINAQVPFELPAGAASLTLTSGGAVAGTANFLLEPAEPGLFLLGQGRAAVLNSDYSINSQNQPAAVGSFISAYMTGLGAVDNPVPSGQPAPLSPLSRVTSALSATIGGQPADVLFAGLAPTYAGLYVVIVTVPQLAPGDYPLQVTVGGVASNTGTISVR